jgi:hypothetical protein
MSDHKMNSDVKALWVAALRSGKYTQEVGYLHPSGGYCCLGVLCEVALDNGVYLDVRVAEVSGRRCTIYDTQSSDLPSTVCDWAGFWGGSPTVVLDSGETALAVCNDKLRLDFNQIANLIETQL